MHIVSGWRPCLSQFINQELSNSPYRVMKTPTPNSVDFETLNWASLSPSGISRFSRAVLGLSMSWHVNPISRETSPTMIVSMFMCRKLSGGRLPLTLGCKALPDLGELSNDDRNAKADPPNLSQVTERYSKKLKLLAPRQWHMRLC
jgi:hypothetical protein